MILIVEDEQINCFLLKSYLDKMQYKTAIANNGLEAIEILEHNEVRFILLDLNMPLMNGYELLTVLNNDERFKYKKYKIIIISTIELVNFRQEVKQKNINIDRVSGYIPKPVDFINLQKLLTK